MLALIYGNISVFTIKYLNNLQHLEVGSPWSATEGYKGPQDRLGIHCFTKYAKTDQCVTNKSRQWRPTFT